MFLMYSNKYLKYKQKYLNLKNMMGGILIEEEINDDVKSNEPVKETETEASNETFENPLYNEIAYMIEGLSIGCVHIFNDCDTLLKTDTNNEDTINYINSAKLNFINLFDRDLNNIIKLLIQNLNNILKNLNNKEYLLSDNEINIINEKYELKLPNNNEFNDNILNKILGSFKIELHTVLPIMEGGSKPGEDFLFDLDNSDKLDKLHVAGLRGADENAVSDSYVIWVKICIYFIKSVLLGLFSTGLIITDNLDTNIVFKTILIFFLAIFIIFLLPGGGTYTGIGKRTKNIGVTGFVGNLLSIGKSKIDVASIPLIIKTNAVNGEPFFACSLNGCEYTKLATTFVPGILPSYIIDISKRIASPTNFVSAIAISEGPSLIIDIFRYLLNKPQSLSEELKKEGKRIDDKQKTVDRNPNKKAVQAFNKDLAEARSLYEGKKFQSLLGKGLIPRTYRVVTPYIQLLFEIIENYNNEMEKKDLYELS